MFGVSGLLESSLLTDKQVSVHQFVCHSSHSEIQLIVNTGLHDHMIILPKTKERKENPILLYPTQLVI